MTLVMDGGPNDQREISYPVIEGAGGDDRWLEAPSLSYHRSCAMLERLGHHVDERRQFVPVDLQDGRQLIVPVDEVEFTPVSAGLPVMLTTVLSPLIQAIHISEKEMTMRIHSRSVASILAASALLVAGMNTASFGQESVFLVDNETVAPEKADEGTLVTEDVIGGEPEYWLGVRCVDLTDELAYELKLDKAGE